MQPPLGRGRCVDERRGWKREVWWRRRAAAPARILKGETVGLAVEAFPVEFRLDALLSLVAGPARLPLQNPGLTARALRERRPGHEEVVARAQESEGTGAVDGLACCHINKNVVRQGEARDLQEVLDERGDEAVVPGVRQGDGKGREVVVFGAVVHLELGDNHGFADKRALTTVSLSRI